MASRRSNGGGPLAPQAGTMLRPDRVPRSLIDAEIRRRQALGDAMAAKGRLEFRDFVAGYWRFVDPRPYLHNWHIEAKCEHLQACIDGQITKLIINEPPGYAKSLVASVLLQAFEWGPCGRPESRYLCVSHDAADEAPALRDAGKCRDLIQTPAYQAEWGPVFRLDANQNAKAFFKNDKHGYRISTGLAGASGARADRLIMDDLVKLDDATPNALKRAINTYEAKLRSRQVDEGSFELLIMQRLAEGDPTDYFLKQDGWVHLRLPAFFEKDHRCRVFLQGALFFEDPRTIEGQPLHPLLTKAIAEAQAQARVRPDLYAGQQQQRPAPLEGGIVKWFKHWDRLPHTFDDYLITVDCAFKDQEQNSYVVLQAWGLRDATAYLLDQIRAHLDLPKTIEAVVVMCARHPLARAKWVEAKANGVGVVQMLKNRMPGILSTDDDEDCLKPFVSGSKEAKISACAPYFQAGNVLLPPLDTLAWWPDTEAGKPWVPDYIHELRTFPNSAYDDQVDATALGVWKLLWQFEAHVGAEIMAPDPGNKGLIGDVFDRVYGEHERAGLAAMEQDAFGRNGSSSLADMARGAFGGW